MMKQIVVCDQCGRKIEMDSSIAFGYVPHHITLDGLSIPTPDGGSSTTEEILDFCSTECMVRFIRDKWDYTWQDHSDKKRKELRDEMVKWKEENETEAEEAV